MKHLQLFENFDDAPTLKPVDITRPGDVLVIFTLSPYEADGFSVALMSQVQYVEFEDLLRRRTPPGPTDHFYWATPIVLEVYEKPGAAYVYYNAERGRNSRVFGAKGQNWTVKDVSFEKKTSDVLYWAEGVVIPTGQPGFNGGSNQNPSFKDSPEFTPNNGYEVEIEFDIVIVLKRGKVITTELGWGCTVHEQTIEELFEIVDEEKERANRAEMFRRNAEPSESQKKVMDFNKNSGWKEIEAEISKIQSSLLSDGGPRRYPNWNTMSDEQKRNLMQPIYTQKAREINTLVQKARKIVKEWENRVDSEWHSVLLQTLDHYQAYVNQLMGFNFNRN